MQSDLPTFTTVQEQIEKIDSDEDRIRLSAVLLKRMIIEEDKDHTLKVSSLVTELLNNPTYRDVLLEIGLKLPDYSILHSFID